MTRTRQAEYILWGLVLLLSSLLVQAFGQENTSADNPPSRVKRQFVDDEELVPRSFALLWTDCVIW
jgi:hypothetical protein